MSIRNLSSIVLLSFLTLSNPYIVAQEIEKTNGKDWNIPKSPLWDELIKKSIPEWMIDAKFGMYTHWGIYSVPAHGGPDYVKELYSPNGLDRKGVKKYHEKKYGPIEDFGYKDFIPIFNAPKFDAQEWVSIMNNGGARFGGICLAHHDGFCLWNSKYTKWDSMDMGPKRDIFGEIAAEVRKTDMKLLATFHMARSYGYMFSKDHTAEERKIWDIYAEENDWIYRNPETESKENFASEWANKVREVINKYRPDVLWFDGLSSSIKKDEVPQDTIVNIFQNYYNLKGIAGDEVVVCNKLPSSKVWNFPLGFGLRCYENCRDMEEKPEGYWLSDRAISYPWSYVNNKNYKDKAPYHIRSLIDMVSRGGIMLMSLTPRGDGSIDPQEIEIMKGIGTWLNTNGEAIYGTRKWKVSSEGTAEMLKYVERKKTYRWTFRELGAADVRFTRSKDNTKLFAIVLGNPESGTYTIKCLNKDEKIATGGISKISLVSTNEVVHWKQTKEGLTIEFPLQGINYIANAFRIEIEGRLLY